MMNHCSASLVCFLIVVLLTIGMSIRLWSCNQDKILDEIKSHTGPFYDRLSGESWIVVTNRCKRDNIVSSPSLSQYVELSQARRHLEDKNEQENDEHANEEHENDEHKEGEESTIAPTASPSKKRNGSSQTNGTAAMIIAPIIFLCLGIWFIYHNYLEKVQEGKYDNAVKTAKQDLLSSDTIVDEESIVVYHTGSNPTNGKYCAVYLEPQPLECGAADVEQKYEIDLRFGRNTHRDDESCCTVDGWSMSGIGYDSLGDQIAIDSGFVTKKGKACWTEIRRSSTVLCNGRFNFNSRTFNGAWLSRNGNGGEFIRFYHQNLSVYSDIDMDSYAYKGPSSIDKKNVDIDEQTEATSDDSYTVIDVSNAPEDRDRNDETRIIDVRYPQHQNTKQDPPKSQSSTPTLEETVTPTHMNREKLLTTGSKQDELIVPMDLTKYQNYEPPSTSMVPKLNTLDEVGRLSPIDEESTLVTVPIALVMPTSHDNSSSSTCSGLSASNSSFQREKDNMNDSDHS
jgi:hypothetical protein